MSIFLEQKVISNLWVYAHEQSKQLTQIKEKKRSLKKCSYLWPYRVNFKAGQLQTLQNHDHSHYETAIYILNESL